MQHLPAGRELHSQGWHGPAETEYLAAINQAEELGLEHTHVVKPPRKARKARAAVSPGTGRRGRPAAVAAE